MNRDSSSGKIQGHGCLWIRRLHEGGWAGSIWDVGYTGLLCPITGITQRAIPILIFNFGKASRPVLSDENDT